jgi:hypothetical protein
VTLTHAQAIVALIGGLITIVSVAGGFGVFLVKRWITLENYIKTSSKQDKKFKESDRRLKKELRKLIQNKYQDHVLFDERLSEIERELSALRNQRGRRRLSRRQ